MLIITSYIPAEYEDRSKLKLLKYDIKENTISVASELPFLANKHVSMLALDDHRLLVSGGTNQIDDVSVNNDETWTRTNNLFFIYNRLTDEWDLDGLHYQVLSVLIYITYMVY